MKVLIILISLILLSISDASSESSSSSSSSSSSESSSSSSSSESSSNKSSSNKNRVKYSYTIWIGDEVDKKYSLDLKSAPGTSFIDAMYQAAIKNKHFRFKKTFHPTNGVLVTELCGVTNDNATEQYWILYDLTSKPDVHSKPCDLYRSTVDITRLEVVAHHYLYWYKTVATTNLCGRVDN